MKIINRCSALLVILAAACGPQRIDPIRPVTTQPAAAITQPVGVQPTNSVAENPSNAIPTAPTSYPPPPPPLPPQATPSDPNGIYVRDFSPLVCAGAKPEDLCFRGTIAVPLIINDRGVLEFHAMLAFVDQLCSEKLLGTLFTSAGYGYEGTSGTVGANGRVAHDRMKTVLAGSRGVKIPAFQTYKAVAMWTVNGQPASDLLISFGVCSPDEIKRFVRSVDSALANENLNDPVIRDLRQRSRTLLESFQNGALSEILDQANRSESEQQFHAE